MRKKNNIQLLLWLSLSLSLSLCLTACAAQPSSSAESSISPASAASSALPASGPFAPTPMRMADVRALAQKGTALTVDDFVPFAGISFCPGVCSTQYNVDEDYILVLSTDEPQGTVQSVRLAKKFFDPFDKDQSIDIFTQDINAYLQEDTATRVVNSLLEAIMSSPAHSSNAQDYIDAHQAEYDQIFALDYKALPPLTAILKSDNGHGLKSALAQQLIRSLLERRLISSYWSPEIEQNTQAAKAALEAYTGQSYIPFQQS